MPTRRRNYAGSAGNGVCVWCSATVASNLSREELWPTRMHGMRCTLFSYSSEAASTFMIGAARHEGRTSAHYLALIIGSSTNCRLLAQRK